MGLDASRQGRRRHRQTRLPSESVSDRTGTREGRDKWRIFLIPNEIHRPPTVTQISLCVYGENEAERCCEHHPAGRLVDLGNEPQCNDKERIAYQAVGRKGGCKYCGSARTIRYGRKQGVQVLKCKDCNHTFEDNGRLPKMRTPTPVIAARLKTYVDGLSHKRSGQNTAVRRNKSTIWRWVRKFAPMVRRFTGSFRADLSDTWHADETAIGIRGNHAWTWFTEDGGTRFIASSLVTSWGRTDEDAVRLFAQAKAVSRTRPARIVTDKLPAYVTGIRRNFYSNLDGRIHLNRIHLRKGPNNNLIERLNGTFKDRTKSMRGFKTSSGAEAFSHAFVVQYNFLRGHESLDGQTPAVAAGIQLPFEDGWGDLMRWATYHANLPTEGRSAS